VCVCVKFCC